MSKAEEKGLHESLTFCRASEIIRPLAHNHGFSDGNKRTALLVMLATLE